MLMHARLVAALFSLFSAPIASAEEAKEASYQVVESNISAYAVGDVVSKLPLREALPEGGFISFLDKDDRTILVENPLRPHSEGATRDVKPPAR